MWTLDIFDIPSVYGSLPLGHRDVQAETEETIRLWITGSAPLSLKIEAKSETYTSLARNRLLFLAAVATFQTHLTPKVSLSLVSLGAVRATPGDDLLFQLPWK